MGLFNNIHKLGIFKLNKSVEEAIENPVPVDPENPKPAWPENLYPERHEPSFKETVKEVRDTRTWRVPDESKQYVASLIARFWTPKEIIEHMKEEKGVTIDNSRISRMKSSDKWAPTIRKLRREYLETLDDIGGAHQKVRLERAERIYSRAVSKDNDDKAMKVLEFQRREMEPEQQNNFSLTLNQYNVMSDEEIEHRRQELLKKVVDVSQGGTDGKKPDEGEIGDKRLEPPKV